MKQTTNMARVIGEIQRIARKINQDWFNGELPIEKCVWTVQSTPKAYAHFTPYLSYRVHDKEGERSAVEINLGAGTLDRKIEDCCASLIHEMTHWYNWLHDVKDTSRAGVYHNKRFKAEAEKHGIHIDFDKTIGHSLTSPTEALIEWCIDNDLEDFRLGRNEWSSYFIGGGAKAGNKGIDTTDKGKDKPKKGNSHLAQCPCCGTKIRYTTAVMPNIICGDCNVKFVEG